MGGGGGGGDGDGKKGGVEKRFLQQKSDESMRFIIIITFSGYFINIFTGKKKNFLNFKNF